MIRIAPLVCSFLVSSAAVAATPQEAADWLKSLNIKINNKEATAELVQNAYDVDFNGVAEGKLVAADLAKLSAFPKLTRVSLGNKAGTDANVAALVAAVPKLKTLSVHNSALSDAAFEQIAKLTELGSLTAFSIPKMTPAAMTQIAKLPKLSTLDISNNAVGDAGLAAIKGSSVAYLSFNGMKGITAAGIASLAAMPQLASLTLQFAEIDGELEALAKTKTLSEISLMSSKLTDKGAKALAKIPTLKNLFLWHTAITDATLADISTLPNLRVLYLTNTKISDAGMKSVAKLPKLETLWVERTTFSDAGAAALTTSKSLKWLKADETKLSDAGLDKLLTISTFESLQATKSGVTPAGVAKFKTARPKGRITN